MDFVWLFKITCHFGQEFVGGNADVNRKAQFFVDPAPHLLRSQSGASPEPFCARHIHPGFIDGILLHHGAELPQHLHKASGGLDIQGIIRLNHYQIRAFFQGLKQGFSGLDSVLFGRGGFCQNDAVPRFFISRHHGRHLPQVGFLVKHQFFISRAPA